MPRSQGFLATLFAPLLWLLNALRWLWIVLLLVGLPTWLYLACGAKEPVFPVENDVDLGRVTAESIAADPEQFPLLSREDYPEAYGHIDRIIATLIAAPEVQYDDLFAYRDVTIIHDDDVLNAFCTPGGFIYVFTGLIHYLEAEDHLAGVLGHEIAHAELRHSSLRLQRQVGTAKLRDLVILAPGSVAGTAAAVAAMELGSLDYSREQEAQADAYSVRYLASTHYACDATAGFFEKLLQEGDAERIPEFLSDHPASAARVRAIREAARELGCATTLGDDSRWRAFQASLPKPKDDAGK